MNKKHLFTAGLAASVGIAGVMVLFLYLIHAPARAAAQNLAAINGITVGQTTEADLLRRPQFQRLERNCLGADCIYRMMAGNTFLSRLHLARPTTLWTLVTVRDGVVTRVSVIGWRPGMPGLALTQVPVVTDCDQSPCVKDLVTPNHVLRSTRISFNSNSDIRNHISQAVNSACLSRLYGCDTNAELMPVLNSVKPPRPGKM